MTQAIQIRLWTRKQERKRVNPNNENLAPEKSRILMSYDAYESGRQRPTHPAWQTKMALELLPSSLAVGIGLAESGRKNRPEGRFETLRNPRP